MTQSHTDLTSFVWLAPIAAWSPVLVWSRSWKCGHYIERKHWWCRHLHCKCKWRKCDITAFCVPSTAHMTSGSLAVENESPLILSAARGKPMCCSCRRVVALSTPDSAGGSMTYLLYMPPSAGKTPGPRDEESAKVWLSQGDVITRPGPWS